MACSDLIRLSSKPVGLRSTAATSCNRASIDETDGALPPISCRACCVRLNGTWEARMLCSDSWNRWLADWRRKDSKARMGRLQDMDQTFTVHGSRAVEVGCIGPSADRGSGHGRRHVRAGRCSMAQSPRLAIDRRRYAAGGSFELMVQVGRVGVPETLGDVGQAQVGPQDVLAGR